ncbi:MAG: amidohydrolase family protein [Chloroflexota bacterium]|nr:amidohydrolase family protein [Chloroflexota bacterium]
MLIADAQVHIWNKVVPGGKPHRPEPFGADELLALMDGAGVDRVVLVPPSWNDDGNGLVIQAAQKHPDRFAAMGLISLTDPVSRELVPTWKATPGLVGIRLPLHTERLAAPLKDGSAGWFWPAAEAAGLPLMIYAPGFLPLISEIAREHPKLRIVIDHLGIPLPEHGLRVDPHVDEALKLASLDNVAVKVSSLPLYSNAPYPFEDVHVHACRALGAFGPSRTFWGTDLSRLSCTYQEAVTMFTERMPCLSKQDQELVMGRALREWIGWT